MSAGSDFREPSTTGLALGLASETNWERELPSVRPKVLKNSCRVADSQA
jgi:hypothetical protein